MQRGKVSEITLKRSILKNIKSRNRKVIQGANLSNDACEIKLEGVTTVMSSNIIETWFEGCIAFNVVKTMNNIYAQGGKPVAVQLSIVVPTDYEEQKLGKLVQNIDEEFGKYHIQISGGHTTCSKNVQNPIVMFTLVGEKCYNILRPEEIQPGFEVVMTKSIAVGGTGIISNLKKEILSERFINTYVDNCKDLIHHISIEKEAEIVLKNCEAALHDVSTGGVFAGMWELTSANGLGVKIELNKIPVWQETVEVAEVFDINPYMLDGTGSLLIVTKEGEYVAGLLRENGINAEVVGTITKEKSRVLVNDDEIRYLEPQRGDEIYKFL